MKEELLELFIKQYIESSEGPLLSFTWHGGEPCLAGLDFFRMAVELQKKHLPGGWKCHNNLQTNGLLLDENWCSFLAKENFDVGLSIDGTMEIHDKHRKDNAGGSSFNKVIKSLELLLSHGVNADILCTVNNDTVKRPLDVYRSLKKLGTGWIQFIPIVRYMDGKPDLYTVSGMDYGNFLSSIFDEWVTKDLGTFNVQLFAESMRVLSGGEASLCWMRKECGRALILEKDGAVYSCDHYVRDDYRLGNIMESHLGELCNSAFQINFGEEKNSLLPEDCKSCNHLNLCRGGCPKDRHVEGLNHLCEGYKRFFSHAKPAMEYVIKLGQLGLSKEEIMDDLKKQLKNIWKGIGRNDPCPCGSGRKAKNCCWDLRT